MPHEYLSIIQKTDTGLEVHGCITSGLAHQLRIPHTTVQLIPVFKGTQDVLIHRRSANRRLYPNCIDFNGGHVGFDLALLNGSNGLLDVVIKTAIHEAREEIWLTVDGQPYIIPVTDVHMFTDLGEMFVNQPMNVEYSTGFVVFLPNSTSPTEGTVKVFDDDLDGSVQEFDCERILLATMRQNFRDNPDDFADGASRILSRLDDNPDFEQKLMRIIQ
jgi:8-oxo-dGTP pyrophosphatase MutT (NUDIX family)